MCFFTSNISKSVPNKLALSIEFNSQMLLDQISKLSRNSILLSQFNEITQAIDLASNSLLSDWMHTTDFTAYEDNTYEMLMFCFYPVQFFESWVLTEPRIMSFHRRIPGRKVSKYWFIKNMVWTNFDLELFCICHYTWRTFSGLALLSRSLKYDPAYTGPLTLYNRSANQLK
jgi:hypothetical protein